MLVECLHVQYVSNEIEAVIYMRIRFYRQMYSTVYKCKKLNISVEILSEFCGAGVPTVSVTFCSFKLVHILTSITRAPGCPRGS